MWAAPTRTGSAPFYDIQVIPGDASVRRNADQMVTAQLVGLQTNTVRLYARYQSASKWEQVAMQPQPGASDFQFLFAGLPENVEYYVEAGPLRSRHFNIRVLDLPGVKNVRVTYRYPDWTRLQSVVEERGGDLRAVEGTEADLEVEMDKPLHDGVIVLDDEKQVRLSGGEGNVYKGTVHMDKDGQYHVAALDQGQPVRLSEDFFIEARKANPPDVRITRPGRDYRSSPIEEVTVAVKADDEFGVEDMTLHYSVNGGPEQTVDLLKQKGVKQADGSTTDFSREFQADTRRPGQSLCHRERCPRRIAHGYFLYTGRAFRAGVLSVSAGWRRRRRWRRPAGPERHFTAREGDHRRHLEAARRQESHQRRVR